MEPSAVLDSRILVVDDEPRVVMLVETMLTSAGYRHVTATTDSARAVELFRTLEPDLLILDLSMPLVHGMDILEDLSEIVPEDEFLPILVLTGDVRPEAKLQALVWGAKDFLTKPFDNLEALLRIRSLLETRLLFQRLAGQRSGPPTA